MEDNRFNRLEERLDSINDRITELAVQTTENSANLKEHMRRTLAVEETNELLRQLIELNKKELEKKIQPLQKFVDRTMFLGTLLSSLFAFVLGLSKLGLL